MSGAPSRLQTLVPGRPWPLGATVCLEPSAASGKAVADSMSPTGALSTGVNFAVWAPDASMIELCVFDDGGRKELARRRLPACSDGVWHGFLPGARPGLVYGLRAHGPWAPHRGHRFNPARLLLDPWAREVVGRYGRQGPGPADDRELAAELALHVGHSAADPERPDLHDNAAVALKARVPAPRAPSSRPPRPGIPRERMVLYEAHVRSLTMRHPDIPQALRGSYAALAHPAMLAHYGSLGITTLSLLPLHFRADEAALQRRGLANHWGYAPIAWLAPETRYWSGRAGTSAASELSDAIDTLHAEGFEVVLDVVFNHTAEIDENGPTLSLRGLANARYYHLAPGNPARYQNCTGCGNSVNLAEPRVVELVIGALRHWAEHYRVDGFRFDLATTLARDHHGNFSRSAGFFAALQADPVLASLKWIAEPWDVGAGGYQLGGFPAGWLEWNDQYRDAMRAWWLRGTGDRGEFAHRFAGSSTQFRHAARAPTASVNFMTAHDGFTLRDLVSFDHKHNLDNGEGNRDGHHHNNSWNCGVEGPTDDASVNALRARLQRALLATLLSSQGTPMLLAGDELGHSQRGNNNAYCQDNPTTWLAWDEHDDGLLACVKRLLTLRAQHPALRQRDWLSSHPDPQAPQAVLWWHPDGHVLHGNDWQARDDRALAIRLQAPADAGCGEGACGVLLLINPDAERDFRLPPGRWQMVFDSDAADGVPATVETLASHLHAPAPTWTVPARCIQILIDSRPTPEHTAAASDTPSTPHEARP
ncbi:MAG: glycogen debranching enzyme GlgX [Betaproteobacteria bacterium]|nr:MAG: glycogen debranching enzyme GlgX [Betaproteobacteria bacterium]